MAKTSVKPADEEIKAENQAVEQVETKEAEKETKGKKEIPEKVLNLMKLYPQYKEFYVTKEGFVHPAGTPPYLTKGATLYQNKFFDK